ncbi:hypothetical protein Tco_0759171 [Tanacetum coccineum]
MEKRWLWCGGFWSLCQTKMTWAKEDMGWTMVAQQEWLELAGGLEGDEWTCWITVWADGLASWLLFGSECRVRGIRVTGSGLGCTMGVVGIIGVIISDASATYVGLQGKHEELEKEPLLGRGPSCCHIGEAPEAS